MAEYAKLYTAAGETLTDCPWNVYPRPQMRRDSFLCLNGPWKFAVGEREPTTYDREICVPFPPQSLLSGIGEMVEDGSTLWYRRSFSLPAGFQKERVLLHFGAVDQHAAVFVNGALVGEHRGGYDAFSFDITDALQEENTLVVRVEDHLAPHVLPYGKQRHDRGGMWYTPVCGIWQTVWLESVPTAYVRGLKITTGLDFADIIVDGAADGVVEMAMPQGVQTVPLVNGRARIHVQEPQLWSPENPYLYDFTVITPTDTVTSYFALRTITVKEVDGVSRLCLNGKPYFFHGLLDQGYWSDGLFLPATPDGFAEDIRRLKALGFTMLRKHIKVEPEQFYYDCDRLGMVVFQDMVNNGHYRFWRDTALPTAGIQRLRDRRRHRDAETRRAFVEGMERTVAQLYNHPSILYWTIFNEGWGQFDSTAMYRHLRTLDDTRIIDSTSGWFRCGETDVDSRHVYFRRIKLKAEDKPLVLSEFGGYSYKPQGHVFNTQKTYGYGKFSTREEFVAALRRLYVDEVCPLIARGLCATVYTQVSDVEDETNGLFSYDRRVLKIRPDEFRDISARLCIK